MKKIICMTFFLLATLNVSYAQDLADRRCDQLAQAHENFNQALCQDASFRTAITRRFSDYNHCINLDGNRNYRFFKFQKCAETPALNAIRDYPQLFSRCIQIPRAYIYNCSRASVLFAITYRPAEFERCMQTENNVAICGDSRQYGTHYRYAESYLFYATYTQIYATYLQENDVLTQAQIDAKWRLFLQRSWQRYVNSYCQVLINGEDETILNPIEICQHDRWNSPRLRYRFSGHLRLNMDSYIQLFGRQ